MTIEEQERAGIRCRQYRTGGGAGQVIDLENEAADLRAAATDAQLTIEHLKRIIADALAMTLARTGGGGD
jgi:hypothetical protein